MARYQLHLSDSFDFGKYKGEKVLDVLHKDPSYILKFCIMEINDFFIYELKEYIEMLKTEADKAENKKIETADSGIKVPPVLLNTIPLYKFWNEERIEKNEENKRNFIKRIFLLS